jgi:hypothetical protein
MPSLVLGNVMGECSASGEWYSIWVSGCSDKWQHAEFLARQPKRDCRSAASDDEEGAHAQSPAPSIIGASPFPKSGAKPKQAIAPTPQPSTAIRETFNCATNTIRPSTNCSSAMAAAVLPADDAFARRLPKIEVTASPLCMTCTSVCNTGQS